MQLQHWQPWAAVAGRPAGAASSWAPALSSSSSRAPRGLLRKLQQQQQQGQEQELEQLEGQELLAATAATRSKRQCWTSLLLTWHHQQQEQRQWQVQELTKPQLSDVLLWGSGTAHPRS
jgi:hypothetical protein